ncbi:winged helix-turn-helix domain-containing protein [Glacieibacterium sp.]|uniref:winged helix-turn-helix domain-containing protein n=1 Tax=Glacieibacterium sp. TaxID=2860237 RepID=UPI003B0007F4
MVPRVGALKLKPQLFCGSERAMGPGKADLLDAIAVHGSISAAGRALGMSYRYTWLQVDGMNRCFAGKLVEATPGGRGGGAVVTDYGRLVLTAYRELEAALMQTASDHPRLAELETMMRDAPLPQGGDER